MKDGFIKLAAAAPALRVSDVEYNVGQIAAAAQEAARAGVRVLVTPELSLTGYTCGDLFFQQTLLDAAEDGLRRLAVQTAELPLLLVVGLPFRWGGKLCNCAAVLCAGRLLGLVPKSFLPNYPPLSELRWFVPGPKQVTQTQVGGETVPFGQGLLFCCRTMPELKIGVEICEDLWAPDTPGRVLCENGATVLLNPCGSSEFGRKAAYRRDSVRMRSGELRCAYAMSVAGTGESSTDLVFSGHQMIAAGGAMLAEAAPFGSGYACADADLQELLYERRRSNSWPAAGECTEIPFELPVSETAFERPPRRQPFMPEDADERARYCRLLLDIQAHAVARRMGHVGAARAVLGISGGLDSTMALLALCEAMKLMKRPHSDILCVTMPGFGTTGRTRGNAEKMCELLGVELRCIPIGEAVGQHFRDIGHAEDDRSVTFENAQARERTQVLMDLANEVNGLVIGTGDLSELALGWATYNGDQMSMYGVNGSLPKTVIRTLVRYCADTCGNDALSAVLCDVIATPVSPELLPAKEGEIEQKTEDLVGPYELHDFFIWHALHCASGPAKIYRLARAAFAGEYSDETILHWLNNFYRRFFSMQFKRSAMPDGPACTEISLSPRGGWSMPSDAVRSVWQRELDRLSAGE